MRSCAVLLIATLAFLTGCQSLMVPSTEKAAVHRTLAAYRTAVNNRSFDQLKPLLSAEISSEGAGPELTYALLQGGAAWQPYRVDDVQIYSIRQTPAGPDAKVALYAGAKFRLLQMGFTPDGRIRSISDVPIWKSPEARVPDVFTSPFVVSGGLMYVKASVNGRPGYMLLDTGASGMLLNQKYFSGDAHGDMSVRAGVNGVNQTKALNITSLIWQGLTASGVTGNLHDFSGFEKPGISPLLGAISHNELKNCALLFDWKHRTVQVFATRANGTKKVATAGPPPTVRIPFTYHTHLPTFPVRIGGVEYSMLFDSGAQLDTLPTLHGIESHSRTIGRLGGFSDGGRAVARSAPIVCIDETLIGGTSFRDLPYIICEIAYFPGKGFLGAPLFQTGRVELNFRGRTISIWK